MSVLVLWLCSNSWVSCLLTYVKNYKLVGSKYLKLNSVNLLLLAGWCNWMYSWGLAAIVNSSCKHQLIQNNQLGRYVLMNSVKYLICFHSAKSVIYCILHPIDPQKTTLIFMSTRLCACAVERTDSIPQTQDTVHSLYLCSCLYCTGVDFESLAFMRWFYNEWALKVQYLNKKQHFSSQLMCFKRYFSSGFFLIEV